MPLPTGTRLGAYEVLGPLGTGGMGEVYRARDSRLGRDVALKVLPADRAFDPERLRRFEQEARAASALNHPNVVTIYDTGTADGVSYVAMELIEGKTLRELGAGESLPVGKILSIAAQIADGLAKAHSAGIIHRDLKPENVMVSNDGFVKILDFGLAKLVLPESGGTSALPTVTKPDTEPGVVMGTVAYMSPEQASGQALDFRTDQFSFGSILYELVAGRRPFEGRTVPETLAAIIREEATPIGELAPTAPTPLRWVVERCLAKDYRERYASTVDLARDLASVQQHVSELSGGQGPLPAAVRRRGRQRLVWTAAALLVGLAAGFLGRGRVAFPRQPHGLARLNIDLSADESLVLAESPTLALSPDGARLVYVGRGPQGRRLYVRELDRFGATPIPGTEGGIGPFFSPDGQWVGFWADRKLKKVSLAGGQPLTICDAPAFRGASWGPDGTILFSPAGQVALLRVSDRGGEATAATKLDPRNGESTHRWPRTLPGGKAAIFTIHGVMTGNYERARIGLLLLGTGEKRTLLEGGTDARYVPTGHLVYLRAGSLFAVPFDLQRLAVTGPPVPVLDGLGSNAPAGFAFYDVSPAGSLVYVPRDPRQHEAELVWVDRKGAATPVTDVRRVYGGPRLSPDGRRLAVGAGEADTDVWILDLVRGSWDRLASGGINFQPVWSSDGKRIAFASNRTGAINVFWIPVDRSAPAEQLTKAPTWPMPLDSSPDGRTLIVEESPQATSSDIAVLSLTGDRELRPLVRTPANETEARISPDGRWLAFQSDESGRFEVYVMAYPGPGSRSQVSVDGGSAPVWSHDGRELFFRGGGNLMAVGVETRPGFRAGLPKPLFKLTSLGDYDVAPGGQRFVMVRSRGDEAAPRSLAVVLDWFDDLKRRVSAGQK